MTRDLTRTFGSYVAVESLNLRVPQGRIFGYLGLNGAGKSTTIKMLCTLLCPTGGSAEVLGHDVATQPLAVRTLIGLLGEDGGDGRAAWSAREYVRYFAGIRGLSDPRRATEAALDAVKLDAPWRRRAMSTYSTGMKRRVELARALLGQPRVLFLDEPTRGLDLPTKRETWEFLRALAKDEGVTMFLSSHEVPEIMALCEDLAVIAKGRITFKGPVAHLGRTHDEFETNLIPLLEREPGEASTTFTVAERNSPPQKIRTR